MVEMSQSTTSLRIFADAMLRLIATGDGSEPEEASTMTGWKRVSAHGAEAGLPTLLQLTAGRSSSGRG